MRKIFLFIVAALFATSMWAECPARYVDTIPAQRYITNMSLVIDDNESNWDWFSFEDTFRNDLSLDRVYHIYTEGRHSTDLTSGCKWFYVTPETDPGNSMHWYRYEYFGERQSSTSWKVDESTGGKVEKDLSGVIKGFVENGIKDIIIVVNPQYNETTVNPVTGETKSGYVSIYGSQDKYDVYNINYYTFSIPAIYRNRLSSNDANFGEEFVLDGYIQAIGAVNYKLQENSDPKAWSWQTVQSGTISTADARAGKDIQYKKLFNEKGVHGKREYRLIATDVASGKSDTTGIRYAEFKYKCVINGQTEYKAAGEKITLPKPADCQDYKITSDLPITKKISGEYIEFTMPACNATFELESPTYVVKFLNADYSLLKADTVECGDAAEAPADPTYGNYTFIGWNKDLTNVHSNMSVLAKYDIGNDYDLNVSLDEHKNKVFPADYFEGSETRAMVGDVLEFSVGIFAVTDASLYYETATWNNSEQRFLWDPNSGKKVGNYKANTTGLLKQEVTVCYDANTQYIHPFEHRLAVRFYLLIAGQRAYSDPYEFDVYYPTGIRTSTAEGVLAENDFGDIVAGTPVMIPARSNDTIRVYGMNGSGGDCFTYRRVIKSSMAVDNGVDEEDNAYFLAPGELDTIVISVAQTAVVFEVTGQGKEEYKKYGNNVYYAEEVDCGGSIAKMPEDPEDAGYIFKGWESWNSSDYPDDAYLNVPAGFTTVGFTAQWEELPEVPQFQVRFYGKDGAPLLKDTLVNEGENAVPPVAPEVSGFHFVGWDKPYTTITANTDITALYGDDAKTWTVTYYDADETTKLGEETVNDGEAAQGIAVVAPEGKHFSYWVEMGTNGIADLTHVTNNMEVYAHYDVNVYEIIYTIDGNIIFSENVNHGAMPTQYEPVEDQGKPSTEQYVYTFNHWNPAIAVATEDATYEAVFTESLRKYTVRFQNWDHTLLKEEPVEYGKAATAPADPTREGYTFKGWDRAFNNIITDMTVTAVFEKNKEQGIEDIVVPADTAQKVLVDGALYIVLPDGKVYNANGLRVK